jgi:hypothetical protein
METFNKRAGSNGDVGIWHETYICQKNVYQRAYSNMPRFDLEKSGNHVVATRKLKTANEKIIIDS